MLFIQYPKCSTCKKALNILLSNGNDVTTRDIVKDVPTVEELKKWHALSKLELNKFFNTSGILYREMQLKDKLKTMSDEEKYALLASNGMLIKRPILIDGDIVLVGANHDIYK